jgi:hypothetical protein
MGFLVVWKLINYFMYQLQVWHGALDINFPYKKPFEVAEFYKITDVPPWYNILIYFLQLSLFFSEE